MAVNRLEGWDDTPANSFVLDAKLEPLCPRHNNKIMRYKASGLPSGTDNRPSYHCGYEGCSVRYDLVNGYFMSAAAKKWSTLAAECGPV